MTGKQEGVSPELLAEAGVWIARLHGDKRSPAMEEGFRMWLGASAEHGRAFELATEVWDDSVNLRRIVQVSSTAPVNRRPFMLAAAAAALLIVGAVLLFMRDAGVATAVGEQRLLTLEDGTRIFMNTATRIVVRYDGQLRRIELRMGEALFSVARDTNRPFIVSAGGREVRALGTSFVVRRDANRLAVTLVEGKVSVSAVATAAESAGRSPALVRPDTPQSGRPGGQAVRVMGTAVTLQPGQRLVFNNDAAVGTLGETSLRKAVAWRSGQVVLDDTALEEAAAEMNRYNNVQVVVEEPAARQLLVNGLFQAGDSVSFANAVAHTYGLSIVEKGSEIVLRGLPVRAGSGAVIP